MSTDQSDQTSTYDTIVIGSGIGSLATASLLAQVGGQRVLVLERHAKLGGFTHSFQRKGFEWDVGLHYVGEMQDGTMPRQIMDLVTGHDVRWHAMGSPYERFIFPEATFEVPVGADAFLERLKQRFPEEAEGLDAYFKDMQRMQGWTARWYTSKQFPPMVARALTWPGAQLAHMSTADYLARFKAPLLRAILAAQWPNFGTPPQYSTFAQHAMVQAHFLEGGFTPEGGSKALASAAQRAIESRGGRCLVSHPVTRILVERGRAVGVEVLRKGRTLQFRAKTIVSGAGVRTTFDRLVPEGLCQEERDRVRRLNPGVSALVLFLGLKDDPRAHGFDDANHWIFRRLDHDTEAAASEGNKEDVDGAFLSFCSLRRPGAKRHTAQIITFGPGDAWKPYGGTEWLNRGDDYLAHKERVAESMLSFVEEFVPGVRALVDYVELATPMSFEHFSGHPDGWVYGQRCDIHRYTDDQWWVKTSLKGLHLTGSDVGSPGIDGALMAGLMTAGYLLGPLGMPRIMMAAQKSPPEPKVATAT